MISSGDFLFITHVVGLNAVVGVLPSHIPNTLCVRVTVSMVDSDNDVVSLSAETLFEAREYETENEHLIKIQLIAAEMRRKIRNLLKDEYISHDLQGL